MYTVCKRPNVVLAEPKEQKGSGRPRRLSLRIAITLPAALHLEAKRKASSLSMSFSEYMRSLIRKDLEGNQQ
jgi:hypothetical protein